MAGSFVEQATLRIDNQASKEVRALNKDILNMLRNARKINNLKIDFGRDITRAQRQIRGLTKSLNALPRSRTVNVNVNQNGRVPRIPRAPPPAPPAPPGRNPPPPGGGGNPNSPWRNGTFQGVVRIAVAYATLTGAVTIAKTAFNASLASQSAETRQKIILNDPELRSLAKQVAASAVAASERVTATRATEITTDAIVGGLRGDILKTVVPRLAQLEGQSQLIDPKRAEELTLLTNKILNLANATDSAEKSISLAEGVFRASIAAGESFNAATTIAALRTSGFANTLDPKGLVGLSLAIDALGQRAGSSLQRLQKELITPLSQAGAGAGISKGSVRSLVSAGIRDETGISKKDAEFFRRDPALFIQTVLKDRLQKNGVNTDDRVETELALAKAGFAETSRRLISDALSSIDEAARARKLVEQVNFSGVEDAAAGDLGAALKNLTAGFDTFASSVLTPLNEKAAPLVNSLGQFLERLGTSGTQVEKLGAIAAVVAGTFGLYAGAKTVGSMLMSPLTGSATALNGSAAALTRAAVALGGSAAADAVPDVGGSKKGGFIRNALGFVTKAVSVATLSSLLTSGGNDPETEKKIQKMLSDLAEKDKAEKNKPENKRKELTNNLQQAQDNLSFAKQAGDIDLIPHLQTELVNAQQAISTFDQTFQTGATKAGTTISAGFEAGANLLTGGLTGALSAGADILAARITAAINSATINMPRVSATPATNTGATAPTE